MEMFFTPGAPNGSAVSEAAGYLSLQTARDLVAFISFLFSSINGFGSGNGGVTGFW
jgi:hypothetical protein